MIASDVDIEEGDVGGVAVDRGSAAVGQSDRVHDHNDISIEDDTNIALSEDVAARYEAYGWHVQTVQGGENVTGILAARSRRRRR